MNSQCSSLSNERNLRRGVNGRFMSDGNSSLTKRRHARRQKAFMQRRKQRKREIHESFLEAVCVPGSVDDWIPGSRSDGPLVKILHTVVTDSHRIGPNGHVEGLREYCNTNVQLGVVTGLTSEGKNPKRVKGFRLPKLTRRHTEIANLQKWIASLEQDELRSSSVEEAIDDCLKILTEFEVGKRRKKGQQHQGLMQSNNGNFNDFVSTGAEHAGSQCPNCSTPIQVSLPVSSDINEPTSSDDVGDSLDSNPVGETRDITSTVSSDEMAHAGDGANAESQEEFQSIQPTSRETLAKEILETAKDDSIFIMICTIFDETRETSYGWYGGQFLREYQRNGEDPTSLVRELLTFCYWRRYGIRNAQEHERREEILRYNMHLLKLARRALQLPGYEELQWKYNSSSHDYIGARNSTNELLETDS